MSSAIHPLPGLETDWPESWTLSHHFDRIEVGGEDPRSGYARMYGERRRRVLRAAAELTHGPADILDIAAAQGNFSIAVAGMGHRVTWNDFRGELADYVRMKMPAGIELAFVPGNILEVEEAYRERFDVVMALEVIEHVAHPDDFLKSLARLVKPSGHIIVSTPNGGYVMNTLPRFSDCPDASIFEDAQFKPDSDGHIFLLHEDEMREQARLAGLDVVRHDLFNNPLTCGHMKSGRLLRYLPDAVVQGVEWLTARLPRILSRKVNAASLTILQRPVATGGPA